MARRGDRETIERGIYRDATGHEVVARAGALRRSVRFTLDDSLASMRTWRDGTTAELREDRQPTADKSSLASAIARYLTLTGTSSDPDKAALAAWQRDYGDLDRRKLKPSHAQQALDRWKHEGYSPQSLYYRRLVIRKLWRALDGPAVRTPVDDIHITRPKASRPVWITDDVINGVLLELVKHEIMKWLRDAKTRARFMVQVSCGMRPTQLRRATAADVVLWEKPVDGIYGIWQVRAAKGGHEIPVYLNSEQALAWRVFIHAQAWGSYDARAFARTLKRCGWPRGVRPYNARHATGLTLSERGIDLADIQSHFGHTSSATTRGFYVPQLHSRLQRLSTTLEGRFGWGGGATPSEQRGTRQK